MSSAVAKHQDIRDLLDDVGTRLEQCGYSAPLAAPEYGSLYTFTDGYRVRIDKEKYTEGYIGKHPEKFSTDAALRPLLADTLLPTCASVLGPGEIAYQAMLKPLYTLFDIPQPVLFPRQSYTILEKQDLLLMDKYGTDVCSVLRGGGVSDIFDDIVPQDVVDEYRDIEVDEFVIPDNISKKAVQHFKEIRRVRREVANRHNIKLRSRHIKQQMRARGYRKGEIQRLRNRIRPKNTMQERVFPMTHFMNRYGRRFIDVLFESGDICDFSHKVVTLDRD